MSTINSYGYSSRMNPKLKDMLKNYKPEDKSGLYENRKKTPFWTSNSVRKMKLEGRTEDLTSEERVNACLMLALVLLLITLMSI